MNEGSNPSIDASRLEMFKIDGLQAVIAEEFAAKWPKTPTVHVGVAVNMDPADRYRRAKTESSGVKISVMHVIQTCVARAAREYPLISGRIDDVDQSLVAVPGPDEIAVSGPVMVGNSAIPIVLRNASAKSVVEVAESMAEIIELLKSRELGFEDAKAAFAAKTSTPNVAISNIGMMGPVNFFTAMPVSPAVAAFYVGAALPTPIVDETGKIVVAQVANFCLAFDHRVLSAGPVAAYIGNFKRLMEEPELLDSALN